MRTGHKIIAYSRQGRTRQWRDRTVQHGLSRPGGTWRCRHSRCPSPLSGPGPADLPDLCQPWYDLGGPGGLLTVPGTRLLGVILSNTLNFEENAQYILNWASRKLWLLRRLKQLVLEDRTCSAKMRAGGCHTASPCSGPAWLDTRRDPG